MAKGLKGMGTKYNCYSCDGKFYDLNRAEPICPKCGANQNEAPTKKVSRAAPAPTPPAEPKPTPKPAKSSKSDAPIPKDAVPGPAVDSDFDDDVDIDALVDERTRARADRDFARAAAIRDELKERGIALEDTPHGTVWHRE